jgi:diadenosine tetraphosphate (Ap4A) HIT family hydrolase
VHFLVIPKEKQGLTRLSKATEGNKALLGHLLYVAQHVAKEQVCLSVFVFILLFVYIASHHRSYKYAHIHIPMQV